MPIILSVRAALKKFAVKVLDVDETILPQNQIDMLNDFKKKFEFKKTPSTMDDFIDQLSKKHMIDSISVATQDGSLITTSNGKGETESILGTSLFNYVKSEIPQSQVLLVKEKDWLMIFSYNQKIYIIKSPAHMCPTELHILAAELEKFLGITKKTKKPN
jgi:hypothetical protein